MNARLTTGYPKKTVIRENYQTVVKPSLNCSLDKLYFFRVTKEEKHKDMIDIEFL